MNIHDFRRKVARGLYEATQHAKDEAAADDFDSADMESIIMTGEIVRKMTHDPRGTRYVILGMARDRRQAELICRLLASGKLRCVTVYLK